MQHQNVRSAALVGALLALQPFVSAAAQPEANSSVTPVRASNAAASDVAAAGLLLPESMAPRIQAGTALAAARSGYDGASAAFVARGLAEGSITRSLALRLEFEHAPSMGPKDRLRIGGRLALLNQEDHGIDGGVALFYDPKDFREEGTVVIGLLAGRQFGRLGVFVNALLGADPEADDALLEARMSALYQAAPGLHVGIDARGRYNLSSDDKRAGTLTTDWELHALPTASLELGPFALVADVGLAAVQTRGPFAQPDERTNLQFGVLALGGAAAAF